MTKSDHFASHHIFLMAMRFSFAQRSGQGEEGRCLLLSYSNGPVEGTINKLKYNIDVCDLVNDGPLLEEASKKAQYHIHGHDFPWHNAASVISTANGRKMRHFTANFVKQCTNVSKKNFLGNSQKLC